MYDSGKIIPGLLIFVLFVTMPIWYNRGTAQAVPEIVLPENVESCVLPLAAIRPDHMKLLMTWRDDVLRDGDRSTFEIEGKQYQKSLQLTCLQCHANKEQFCDPCHTYVAVRQPNCWDCHFAPVE